MASILDICVDAARKEFAAGAILLSEGETSGQLYILAEGSVEILRGDTQVAVVSEPGAVFGEMSVLLKRPHTATVRTTSPVGVLCSKTPKAFSSPIPRSRSSRADCSPNVSTQRRPI